MRDVAFVLIETLKTPEFPSKSRMQIQWQKSTPLSPDEALAYLLGNTLTKQQYISNIHTYINSDKFLFRNIWDSVLCKLYTNYYLIICLLKHSDLIIPVTQDKKN